MRKSRSIFFPAPEEELLSPARNLLLALILILAACLRFLRLGAQSFWTDEVAGIIMADRSLVEVIGVTALRDVNPPLGYVLIHFWAQVSHGEAWMRALPAGLGVLSVYLLYRWVRGPFGDRVALLSALLLAVSPLAVYLSQEVRYYNLGLVLALFNLTNLAALERAPDSRPVEGRFVLGWWLGWLTHYFFFLLYLAGAVYFLAAHSSRHRRRFLWLSTKSFLYFSPWLPVLWHQFQQKTYQFRPEVDVASALFSLWAYFSYGHSDRLLPGLLPFLDDLPRYAARFRLGFLGLTAPFAVALLSSLVRGRRGDGRFLALCGELVLLPLVAVLATSATTGLPLFRHVYFILFFPAFLALLARGLDLLVHRNRLLGGLLLAALLSLQGLSLHAYFTDPRYQREDWRGLAARIRAEIGPGDAILTYSIDSAGAFYFYAGEQFWSDHVRTVLSKRTLYFAAEDREELSARMRYLTRRYERLWFIGNLGYMFEPAGLVRDFLAEHAALAEDFRPRYRIDGGLYVRDRLNALAARPPGIVADLVFGQPHSPLQVGPGFLVGPDPEEWVWMSGEGNVWLPAREGARAAEVECLLSVGHLPPPVAVSLEVNGEAAGQTIVAGPEVQRLRFTIPDAARAEGFLHLRITTDKTFVLPEDGRPRSLLVRSVRLID